ncbi:MAG: N-acetylglucosamine-6-phosphate deacetylase [Paracoccaceae bacterium]
MTLHAFQTERIFDGEGFRDGALLTAGGVVLAIVPSADVPAAARRTDLGPGLIAPGFVDLQVNGGGGVMLNDDPTPDLVATIARAQAQRGTTALLPALITDRPDVTRAAVAAVEGAVAAGVRGVAGLHLEGPHLAPARKGAHEAGLIRPMGEGDLAFLLDAARRLPRLVVTLAPESATPGQIAALAGGGVVVSLGHSDAGFEAARAAMEAGARMVTHLFNAMSQLGNRDPGLVGAALSSRAVSAGLIADGVHVHPETIRTALAAKRGPGTIFLVTDAMAVAGTGLAGFTLNGRAIGRHDGRLTLADGTLAGADIDFAGSLRLLTGGVGVPLEVALAMATSGPARAAGLIDRHGLLRPGRRADFVHLRPDLTLAGAWQGGEPAAA